MGIRVLSVFFLLLLARLTGCGFRHVKRPLAFQIRAGPVPSSSGQPVVLTLQEFRRSLWQGAQPGTLIRDGFKGALRMRS